MKHKAAYEKELELECSDVSNAPTEAKYLGLGDESTYENGNIQ